MNAGAVLAHLTFVVAMPLSWYVTVRLWRLYRRQPTYKVLRERMVVSVALAIIVTVFALIFENNEMAKPVLNGEATKLVTRMTVLVVAVGADLYWLRLYRNGTAR